MQPNRHFVKKKNQWQVIFDEMIARTENLEIWLNDYNNSNCFTIFHMVVGNGNWLSFLLTQLGTVGNKLKELLETENAHSS